jgi:hypothetical protein
VAVPTRDIAKLDLITSLIEVVRIDSLDSAATRNMKTINDVLDDLVECVSLLRHECLGSPRGRDG